MGNVPALEDHLTTGWLEVTAKQIEERGLTRPIGSNDGMQRIAAYFQIDIVNSYQSAEFLAKIDGFKNDVGHLGTFQIGYVSLYLTQHLARRRVVRFAQYIFTQG